jgi:hypothetical protein
LRILIQDWRQEYSLWSHTSRRLMSSATTLEYIHFSRPKEYYRAKQYVWEFFLFQRQFHRASSRTQTWDFRNNGYISCIKYCCSCLKHVSVQWRSHRCEHESNWLPGSL